jgi:hypothetical protein
MPDLRFIERRDGAEVAEGVGPFERGSDLFWREYNWQIRLAELHNGRRQTDSPSRQTVHVLDGDRREITIAADI